MKKIIGALLIASPFIVISAQGIYAAGLTAVLATWGLVVLIVIVVFVGVYLIVD